ncbi:hypothetical protein C7B69_05440 [filamentous cyanobacterium Phorm 46]|nr:hypothetical protein C7B69_05440 [filamentous cyanobacterium Phorm 46]PSB52970.1 hypothetical protein C7B67_05115 [filamentous cyanobacterium Phorm 6]
MSLVFFFADMKEPQMAVGLENLVYQINWIFAICDEVDFNRYLGLLPLVCQGFKPLAGCVASTR